MTSRAHTRGGRAKLIASVSLAALIAALTPSGSAHAAVTIGQTGTANSSCPVNTNLVQSATAGSPTHTVPAGFGVITSWSFQGHAPTPGSGKMVVWRPTAAADQFVVVGKSALQSFTAGVVLTFATRIPVQPGDLLGFRAGASSSGDVPCLRSGFPAGDQVRFSSTPSDPEDGSTQALASTLTTHRVASAFASDDKRHS